MDNIDNIILKYKDHPRNIKIRENVTINNIFEYKDVTPEEIGKEIKQLNPKKACIENDMPTKV